MIISDNRTRKTNSLTGDICWSDSLGLILKAWVETNSDSIKHLSNEENNVIELVLSACEANELAIIDDKVSYYREEKGIRKKIEFEVKDILYYKVLDRTTGALIFTKNMDDDEVVDTVYQESGMYDRTANLGHDVMATEIKEAMVKKSKGIEIREIKRDIKARFEGTKEFCIKRDHLRLVK